MELPRLHHVSVPRTPGSHAEAAAFYTEILGLPELVVPNSLIEHDISWFALGDSELHLYGQADSAHEGRHFCIEVEDLPLLRAVLAASGYFPTDTIDIPGRPRFICEDPFGNLIEFTRIEQDV